MHYRIAGETLQQLLNRKTEGEIEPGQCECLQKFNFQYILIHIVHLSQTVHIVLIQIVHLKQYILYKILLCLNVGFLGRLS